ncbi:MAG TPA: hypothetical protein VL691_17245 [Vicinamibacteria bacterium]|nr:hypothetical protein [Vicinamibacteria bacterium]
MNARRLLSLVAGLMSTCALAAPGRVAAEPPPKVQIPQPGVPQIMTMEGRYVRAAYNNEGYVILGYRLVNLSVGEPWMLLEIGVALREGVPDYDLAREAVSLDTPDGKTLPLPPVSEYRKANLSALQARSKVQRDSINYFPPNAYRPCRIGFFADLEDRALPWDKVQLTSQLGCVGRLYFEIPGGITYGQHWLNVKFQKSLIRVPFRVLTKTEDEHLEENFRDIKKQVDEAFRKKS